MTPEPYDRFTFQPGELTEITDPERLEEISRITGIRPFPPEKQAWIAKEGKRRIRAHIACNTKSLSAEYDRLKAEGKL